MDILEILGYFGALLIGVVLGLIGGGGSILTVPVLVYLMAVNPVTATAYSLFVVGTSSLVGAIRNIPKKLIDFRTAFVFAIPAFIAVYLTRKFLVPAIPEEIFSVSGFTITKNIGIMLFFAIIMVIAAISMIKEKNNGRNIKNEQITYNYPLIIIEGFVVGLLTGIVGAGRRIPDNPGAGSPGKTTHEKAVATSLLIIAVKSLIGFIGDVQNLEIEWMFLMIFTGLSIGGIWLGVYLNNFINGKKLKKGFGWFVLLMGLYIIWKELF